MVGTDAMSAVSAASPFVLINNGIAVLLGIGSGSILSRAIGAKDWQTVDKIMGNLSVLVLLMSACVMAVGIPLAPVFLRLSGAQGAVLDMGVSYLRTVYIGSVFVNFMQGANMAGGAVLNIILDPVFILLLPGFGPQAVAVATVVSQLLQAAVTLWYFLRKSPVVKFHALRLEKKLTGETFAVGVSAMLMQVMMLIQMTVVYNTAVKYGGADQIALMGAALRVMQLAFVPVWGMSQGLQPAVGTNYGAKNYDRVKKLTNVFIAGSTCLSLVFWLVIECFARGILSAFITQADIVAKGITNFRLMFAVFPTYGLLIMTLTYLQSLGKAKQAGLLVVFRQFALIVPLVLLFPVLLGGNVVGVWAALPLNDIVILVFSLVLLIKEYKVLERI